MQKLEKYLFILYFHFLAIKYEVSLPNDLFPDLYRCTHHECDWRDYKKGTHWDFFLDNGRNISGCRPCMQRCSNHDYCHSLECGEDHTLPDGTTKYAYCSWWDAQSCKKYDEFTLNPNNYILTCRKKEGKSLFVLSLDKIE